MPQHSLGVIGKRRVWAIVALLASLGTIAMAITTAGAFWFALPIATVVVFVSNHSRLQQRHHHALAIVDTFDAWIGGAVTAFLGVGIALFFTDSLLGLGAAFFLAFLWRIEWVYPRLDRHAVMAWVETAVRDAWRTTPGIVQEVGRERFHATFRHVSFWVGSDHGIGTGAQRRAVAQVFARPFVFPVLFADDALAPFEMTEFVAPRLTTVVDVGAIRELDTRTPLWRAPTTAHARLAFEASL